VAVGRSSMVMEPERRSKSRKRVSKRDDLPLSNVRQDAITSNTGLDSPAGSTTYRYLLTSFDFERDIA
jgi:hypothetical protein